MPVEENNENTPLNHGDEPHKNENPLVAAFEALASMPDDFFAEGRVDEPPQPFRESF